VTEVRAELSSAEINDLPDSAFAYIEAGGKRDSEGKTTPRKLRHYPVHDKAHASNALSRADAQIKEGAAAAKTIAKAALPKIKAAVAKFAGSSHSAEHDGEHRDAPTAEDYGIAYSLKDAKMMLAGVKAKQLADPDLQTDPDDAAVMQQIEAAEKALDKAIVAQSKDGHEDQRTDGGLKRCPTCKGSGKILDGNRECPNCKGSGKAKPESKSRNWATPKARSLFVSGHEWTPPQTIEAQVRMEVSEEKPHLASFRGFPSPTGVTYSVRDWLGEYEETIHPGAWAKTIQESREIPTLLNHNTDGVPLANTPDTKELAESDRGLREDSVFDKRDANTNSVCVQLERGVLSKMSISFRAVKEAWNDAYDKRGVIEGGLYETSIVTFPASPTAEGGLVDAMRSALGREGRSLWLSDSEPSVRSALPMLVERHALPDDSDDMIEKALRALAHADEMVARSAGSQGRARTFLLAEAMVELRAGKALSAKNEGLLKTALDALSGADKHHTKLAASHAKAADAVASVLEPSGNGTSNDTPPSNGNPILSQDGAGPRSASLSLQRQREAELRALQRR
jgi:HK97 family phage prohead protease